MARLVGINHVALEVGDIDAALEFYGRIFDFTLRGRSADSATVDMGDQFINFFRGTTATRVQGQHFGVVVDDRSSARALIEAAGGKLLDGRFLDFLDPWGNRIEIVGYENIQFSKAINVLHGMGLSHLSKNGEAIKELTEKGMAPD